MQRSLVILLLQVMKNGLIMYLSGYWLEAGKPGETEILKQERF